MRRLDWLCAAALLGVTFVLFEPRVAAADNLSPLLVEMTELRPGVFSIATRTPPNIAIANQPVIEMPKDCADLAPKASVARKLLRCEGGLRGRTVTVRYPQYNPSAPTIFRFTDLEGARVSKALAPHTTAWTIPQTETWARVARDYTALGVEHILASLDHLLFLVCLLWIAGSLKRVVVTITGFTLAHSVTLALSTLKLVHIPQAPVEIGIALSILFLAREAAVGRSESLTWRYPVVISSCFGLLHGLGFAAALMEVGLPRKELVAGLLFFNVGVEFGQVSFIMILTGLAQGLKLLNFDWPRALAPAPVYAVGSMSAYWTLRNAWDAFVSPI
jgi:hydrogenase/urease accessory protein HupE